MIRVIQRVFGWQSERKRPREDRKLWAFAETLVPEGKCREFNWGVLDFGAFICTHRKPKCPECLLNEICDYYQAVRSNSQPQ
jgi:A/G-specific adenine glycosylase